MSLTLYAHPFSSYCQKVLITLYENTMPFTLRMLGDIDADRELARLWPIKRMPILDDAGHTLMEASIIVEHLGLHHGGVVRLMPQDSKDALDVRFMDRFFDNYVMTPIQRIVSNHMRQSEQRDEQTAAEARSLLETAYRWLDQRMAGREWACSHGFSLADCAAAPALSYADWTHPIDDALANVRQYRARLLSCPSFARAVDEARPYRPLFPLGAPNRD